MAWTSLSFGVGSLLTSAKMTQLYDNITATANGDSGAPEIVAAALASNSVTTAKITDANVTTAKIADGNVTTAKIQSGGVTSDKILNGTVDTVDLADDCISYDKVDLYAVGASQLKTSQSFVTITGTSGIRTLPGGEYGFYPRVSSSAAGNLGARIYDAGSGAPTSYTTTIYLTCGNTGNAQQRYVAASPPYKIENIDFGAFVFVLVNSNGKITSTWEAMDPPWWTLAPKTERKEIQADGTFKKFYTEYSALDKNRINGSLKDYKEEFNKINQERKEIKRLKQREKYILNLVLNAELNDEERQAAQEEIAAINAQLSGFEVQEKEITPEVKNIGMRVLPHPFLTMAPGEKIVILSPLEKDYDFVSNILDQGESVGELLNEGYIKLGTDTDLVAPNGCKICRFGFK